MISPLVMPRYPRWRFAGGLHAEQAIDRRTTWLEKKNWEEHIGIPRKCERTAPSVCSPLLSDFTTSVRVGPFSNNLQLTLQYSKGLPAFPHRIVLWLVTSYELNYCYYFYRRILNVLMKWNTAIKRCYHSIHVSIIFFN